MMMKRHMNRKIKPVMASSSCVTLKDLCQQDKERVKKLVEDLAIVGTEKEEIDQVRKEEKYQYEMKLFNLQKLQMKLSEENKILEENLKRYKQELKELQRAENKKPPQETPNPNSFKPPPTHFPANSLPPSIGTIPVPLPPPLQSQPCSFTQPPQSTHYFGHSMFNPHALYPPPYLAPQPHQLYQSYPRLFSHHHRPSLNHPHHHQHQPPPCVRDRCGRSNIARSSVGGGRNCAVRNTPPMVSQHDEAPCYSNTTWCTLPESDYVAASHLQFEDDGCVEQAVPDLPPSVCKSTGTSGALPVNDAGNSTTAGDLSCVETLPCDGNRTASESIRQSTPTGCGVYREKDSAVSRTETVSTQTEVLDFAPSASLSRQHPHKRETSLAVTKYRLSTPNTPPTRQDPTSSNARYNQEHHQSVVGPSMLCCDISTVDHQETELLSEILNQSPNATSISLDGLSVSLIDASEQQDQDDDELIKDVFYVTY